MKFKSLFLISLVLLLTFNQVNAGLFSNDGILTKEIPCQVKSSGGFKLAIARFHVKIEYGHNDVNLFHPVVAISNNQNQVVNLEFDSAEGISKFKIPALNIEIPANCTKPGYEEETLRSVQFSLKLYFKNDKNEFELLVVSPETMKVKEQIKYARSKKLTKRLAAIFSSIKADYDSNDFSIIGSDEGIIYIDRIRDQAVLEELQRSAKASKLHSAVK